MEDLKSYKSITLRIPPQMFDWLDKHHWCAKTSRSAFAAQLLELAIEGEMPAHADEDEE